MRNSFFNSLLVSNFVKALAQRGHCAGVAVNLFVKFSEKRVTAGTAALSDASVDGRAGVRRTLQNYDLPRTDDSDQAVVGSSIVLAKFQSLP